MKNSARMPHCEKHAINNWRCEECLRIKEEFRRQPQPSLRKTDPKTQHDNGLPKTQGVYSQENWARFNKLGRELTNGKDR